MFGRRFVGAKLADSVVLWINNPFSRFQTMMKRKCKQNNGRERRPGSPEQNNMMQQPGSNPCELEPFGLDGAVTGQPDICKGDLSLGRLLEFSSIIEEPDWRSTSIASLGFPNMGETCYMNSCLQSLLTLHDFIRDISCHERIWSSVPQAKVMRDFMAIKDAHFGTDFQTKTSLLRSFKQDISSRDPLFWDYQQKDAHEFLISVLDQMRDLSPVLKQASMETTYSCPVEDNLLFTLENTRICKRCGAQSRRLEELLSLSLDLIPGGSMENMLEKYLKEKEMKRRPKCRCQCGGKTSGRGSAFCNLPRVLILHLKRFRFNRQQDKFKMKDSVKVSKRLVVPSHQGDGCYNLISTISHIGPSGKQGHYMCDRVHPEDFPDKLTDRWITFSDSNVVETTGTFVCKQRHNTVYILFYKRESQVCSD